MSEEDQKAPAKKETATYVVIKSGTCALKRKQPDLKVGDTVELTPEQAAARVNKVRLKDEGDAAESKAGRKSRLETEHKELTQRVSEFEKKAEAGNQRITELEAQNVALKAEIDKLKAPPQ